MLQISSPRAVLPAQHPSDGAAKGKILLEMCLDEVFQHDHWTLFLCMSLYMA